MKNRKTYLRLTLLISILLGVLSPLALGVKGLTLIAICFSLVWFVYAVVLLVTTFLTDSGLRIKASHQNGVTVVRYELSNARKRK